MFIRPCYRTKDGKRHAYWALVESYRSERGPRQRIVAYLGQLDEAGRLGVRQAAQGKEDSRQRQLFDETQPEWVSVNAAAVRVENCRQFGGPWLALELIKQLGLHDFLERALPSGREDVPWSLTALILIIARLCEPSSELHIAEHFYRQTALPELLGVPVHKVDDNRLYRGLDQLLPHKESLEKHLKHRLGELFGLEYDLLLYDVTSTYFEGRANFPLAQRGYSRDQRSDCKQVCIALVVSRCGMPLGYEVFAGNTADVTTVEHIVTTMETRYGQSDRIWVMDRGMVSEENIEFLKEGKRRYIIGTPKAMLKKFAQELLKEDWHTIRDGLEVKLCRPPRDQDNESQAESDEQETFILCRSRDRFQKDEAILKRFELRIETTDEGHARLSWKKGEALRDWATLSAGCYLLRSNVTDWTDEELWKAYIQLTEAEAAFRIHKSDLSLRPIWHQKEERVLAHILVCFLAYVLWKMLAQLCQRAGLGNEPRRVLQELADLRSIDVILPTSAGTEIRKRCLTKPNDHQTILLHHLGLPLPTHLEKFSLEM